MATAEKRDSRGSAKSRMMKMGAKGGKMFGKQEGGRIFCWLIVTCFVLSRIRLMLPAHAEEKSEDVRPESFFVLDKQSSEVSRKANMIEQRILEKYSAGFNHLEDALLVQEMDDHWVRIHVTRHLHTYVQLYNILVRVISTCVFPTE